MRRAIGPDCPDCGCNGVELLAAGERHGKPWAKFKCGHCHVQFMVGRDPGKSARVNSMRYTTVRCRCPRCGAPNPPVTHTQGRVRYHLCQVCETPLKSIEAE